MSDNSKNLLNLLIKVSKEYFKGKLNIFNHQGQHLGHITLIPPYIVEAKFAGLLGTAALKQIVSSEILGERYKFVEEPGSYFKTNAVGELQQLIKMLFKFAEEFKNNQLYRPPMHIGLKKNKSETLETKFFSKVEQKLWDMLDYYYKVEDLYKNGDLPEHELTQALVNLRKTGYLTVFHLPIRSGSSEKTKKHNNGELKELSVMIESAVVDSVQIMAKNSGLTPEEIVVIALKRFRAAHSDYEDNEPNIE